MGDEVKRLRPGQQTRQEINLETEQINLNTDDIEGQQIDGTQQTRITDGTTVAGVAAANQALQVDLTGLAGADVDADAGNASAQTQRVTLATDDVLTLLIKDALEILDDIVATFGVAAVAKGAQLALLGKDNVPAAVTEGQAVAALADRIGQLFIKGYNRAQGSLDVSVVAQTKIPPIIQTDWVALTVAGTFTPWRDVRIYSNPTVEYIISAIGTDVDLIIQGAIAEDKSNPFTMWEDNILAAEDQVDAVFWHGLQVTHIRCGLVAINGGTPSVVFYLTDGNSG